MCILVYCDKARMTSDILRRMIQDNADGIGIGWQVNGAVQWEKGRLTIKRAMSILKKLPLPYVVHTRWATVGHGAGLAHPFPIDIAPMMSLSGAAPRVLFHNGHVSEWRALYEIAHGHKVADPSNWSDTRALASIVAKSGESVLGSIGGRFIVMDGKKTRFFGHFIREHGMLWSTRLPLRERKARRYFLSEDTWMRSDAESDALYRRINEEMDDPRMN